MSETLKVRGTPRPPVPTPHGISWHSCKVSGKGLFDRAAESARSPSTFSKGSSPLGQSVKLGRTQGAHRGTTAPPPRRKRPPRPLRNVPEGTDPALRVPVLKTGKGGGRPPAGRRPLAPARRWLALTWRLICCPALPVTPPPEAAPGPTCLPAVPAVGSSAFRPWPPARRPGPTPVPPERPPCTAPHAHATATLASRITRGSSRVSSQRGAERPTRGPSRHPPSTRRSTRPSRRLPRSRASPAPLAARRAPGRHAGALHPNVPSTATPP